MPRFKVFGIFSGGAKVTHAKQTWWNQKKAAKQNRSPKWYRRMLKRSRKFFPFDYAINRRTGRRKLVFRGRKSA